MTAKIQQQALLYSVYHSPTDDVNPKTVPIPYFLDVYCPAHSITVPASVKRLGNGGRARDWVMKTCEKEQDTRTDYEMLQDEFRMIKVIELTLSPANFAVEWDRIRTFEDRRQREKAVRHLARDLRIVVPGLHMLL